jgi:hypothetical protein
VITSQTRQSLPVLAPPSAVLDAEKTSALRDMFADQIFADAERDLGLDTALKRLAPPLGRRRRPGRAARAVRRAAGDLHDVAIVAARVIVTAIAVAVLGPLLLVMLGPFAYELGV